MKKWNKKYLLCALLGCLFLTGCDSTTISLEEALLQNGQGEFVEAETQDAQALSQSEERPVENLVVYVCGSVNAPGVYELPEGSRIVAAIEAAGGFSFDAATEAINLAEPLQDGMQVNVPSVEDEAEAKLLQERAENGLVNINKATEEELCTLPGIGESKAVSIIKYREENGPFQNTEEMKNVSGIGENLFLQIVDRIYIE
jgi:competence protein ComEA